MAFSMQSIWLSLSGLPAWPYSLAGGVILLFVTIAVAASRKRQSRLEVAAPEQFIALTEDAVAPSVEDDARIVRVFISSTFIDMQQERAALVNRTFPRSRTLVWVQRTGVPMRALECTERNSGLRSINDL